MSTIACYAQAGGFAFTLPSGEVSAVPFPSLEEAQEWGRAMQFFLNARQGNGRVLHYAAALDRMPDASTMRLGDAMLVEGEGLFLVERNPPPLTLESLMGWGE